MTTKARFSIYTELSRIQQDIKAPKGQYNSFGKYKYRSCEDILEAAKPVLGECSLILNDEIVVVGDRFYVKAVASLHHPEAESPATSTAFAREALTKKGMDEAQVTGSSSSYARKYALQALLALDDNKDPDTTNDHQESPKSYSYSTNGGAKKQSGSNLISDAQVQRMYSLRTQSGIPMDEAKAILAKYGFSSGKEVTKDKYDTICKEITAAGEKTKINPQTPPTPVA